MDEKTQAILYYVQHLAVLVGRQSDQILQEQLGIGMSQFRILQTLQANPNIQQKQAASLLGQTEASISRQVKLMLVKGMVEAKINPRNRREHLIAITMKGERLLDAGTKVVVHFHQPMFDTLRSKEQDTLLKLLSHTHNELCSVDGLEGVLHTASTSDHVH